MELDAKANVEFWRSHIRPANGEDRSVNTYEQKKLSDREGDNFRSCFHVITRRCRAA
jgi:hypothetical protein